VAQGAIGEKMKKRVAIILSVIIAATLLSACASAADQNRANESMMTGISSSDPMSPQRGPQPENQSTGGALYDREDIDYSTAYEYTASGSGIVGFTMPVVEGFAEKIIYNVYADIETVNFDDSIVRVNALIVSYNAFIEDSNVSGRNYASQHYGWTDYRSADYTIRVPKEHLDTIIGNLDGIGNVTFVSRNATNITSQFIDTQSRLNSLKVEEERLLDMLSKAEDVPALIMIEERLSHVRYQIESLTTTLRTWQNLVDYSTLTLRIREVEQYTERTEIHRTYWEQIGDGFSSTMKSVGRFFMDFFKWLIVSAPVLIILAVIGVAVFIFTKAKLKASAKKRANKPKPAPYQYPPVYGQSYAAPQTEQKYAAPQTEQNYTAPPTEQPSTEESVKPE